MRKSEGPRATGIPEHEGLVLARCGYRCRAGTAAWADSGFTLGSGSKSTQPMLAAVVSFGVKSGFKMPFSTKS